MGVLTETTRLALRGMIHEAIHAALGGVRVGLSLPEKIEEDYRVVI